MGTLGLTVLQYLRKGPLLEEIAETVSCRETAARYRILGYRIFEDLYDRADVIDQKVSIICSLLSAVHPQDDAHFSADLEGTNANLLEETGHAWLRLLTKVIADCRQWHSEIARKGPRSASDPLRALVSGLCLSMQDFRPSDSSMVKQSGLLNLLISLSDSPEKKIRLMSLKFTELIILRCCTDYTAHVQLRASTKTDSLAKPDDALSISPTSPTSRDEPHTEVDNLLSPPPPPPVARLPSSNIASTELDETHIADAIDTLLPVGLEIICSKVSLFIYS